MNNLVITQESPARLVVEFVPPAAPLKIGTPGTPGLSAYQVALANGFRGTEQEWLASLRGPQGPGDTGDEYTAITSGQQSIPLSETYNSGGDLYINGLLQSDSTWSVVTNTLLIPDSLGIMIGDFIRFVYTPTA